MSERERRELNREREKEREERMRCRKPTFEINLKDRNTCISIELLKG